MPQEQAMMQMAYDQISDYSVTFRDVRREVAFGVLHSLKTSVSDLYHFSKTHTTIHPAWLKVLEMQAIPVKRYVRTEKLLRSLKVQPFMSMLLAVDGLGGSLKVIPNFEYKNYTSHLVVGPDTIDYMDDFPEYKRNHIRAVRKMYAQLDVEEPEKYIYTILRDILKEVRELPKLEEKLKPLTKNVYDRVLKAYLTNMEKKDLKAWFDSMRIRGEKRKFEESK